MILEDEVTALKLTVTSLKNQIEEQRIAHDNSNAGLMKDRIQR